MRVAMMQPAFMPWQGFFELICQADKFIFLDDFQFSVRSYHQRNRLFVNRGQIDWYTIPVRTSISSRDLLNCTAIAEDVPWKKKVLKRIQYNYRSALYYKDLFPLLEKCLSTRYESLAAQNIALILLACCKMQIDCDFYYSSQYPTDSKRSWRILELLQWLKADCYLCARGSFGYMLEDGVFPVDDVEVLFQNFMPSPYKQIGAIGDFVPYLSAYDALFNIGPDSTLQLLKTGTKQWLTWNEMKASSLLKQNNAL